MDLPLFPLNAVVFPAGMLPLRIFEPRYLDMVSQCMRTDTGFGVCLTKTGREIGRIGDIHRIGTLCKIVDWTTLQDGLLGITAQGERKIHVLNTREQHDRLLVGQVELAPEEPEKPLLDEFGPLRLLLERIIAELGPPYSELPAFYGQAGWVSARLTELLPLELAIKQQLLETDDAYARLEQLREAMAHTQLL